MKKALVTGASEGIGRCFALELAGAGYGVHLVARNRNRLETLLAELPGKGHSLQVADLARPEGQDEVAAVLREGRWHLLVNNAGQGLLGSFQELSSDAQTTMIDLNVKALVGLSHAFLHQSEKGDAIVNVSSLVGFFPFPPQGVYAATKAFVISFTQSLWYEQKGRGVFVMGICPGATRSEFWIRSGGEAGDVPDYVHQSPEQVVRCLNI